MSDVTKDDLRDARDTLYTLIRDGFDGTHRRLNLINGQITDHQELLGRHDERIGSVERAVKRQTSIPTSPKPEGDDRSVSQRDVRLVLLGAGGLTVAVGFFWKVLPFMVKALTP